MHEVQTMLKKWRFVNLFLVSAIVFYVIGITPAAAETSRLYKTKTGGKTIHIHAVPGRTVTLPCDTKSDNPHAKLSRVFWFRENSTKPLHRCSSIMDAKNTIKEEIEACKAIFTLYENYTNFINFTGNRRHCFFKNISMSFDVNGQLEDQQQWPGNDSMTYQTSYDHQALRSYMTIRDLTINDIGKYHCQVDFISSPSRTKNFQLNLVVPPHQILLYDNFHKDLAGVVGPVNEGDNVNVFCEVRGGHPQPEIKTYINNNTVKSILIKNDGMTTVFKITINNIGRYYDENVVRCSAYNTHVVPAAERSATITMRLKQIDLKLEAQTGGNMSADTYIKISCKSRGSKPPAVIQWFKGTEEIFSNQTHLMGPVLIKTTTNTGLHETNSTIKFMLKARHHQMIIQCHGANPLMPNAGYLTQTIRLDVTFKPIVRLVPGPQLNLSMIKEGDDVYFDCEIESNPNITRFNFLKDGKLLNQSRKYILSSVNTLILPHVTKTDSGKYACTAANEIGVTVSKGVSLVVQYVPECDQTSPSRIGAHIHETINIACKVRSEVPESVTIIWTLNNRYTNLNFNRQSQGTQGALRYLVASERDFGNLLCRGKNPVGVQSKPCVINIVPAGRAQPPKSCKLFFPKFAGDEVRVLCYPSDAGAAPQLFTLEAQTFIHKKRVILSSSEEITNSKIYKVFHPNDKVWLNMSTSKFDGLRPYYTLAVYVRTFEDESKAYELGIKVQDFEKPAYPTTTPDDSHYYIIRSSVAAVIVFISITIIVIWVRRRPDTALNEAEPQDLTSDVPEVVIEPSEAGCSSVIDRELEEPHQIEQPSSEEIELTERPNSTPAHSSPTPLPRKTTDEQLKRAIILEAEATNVRIHATLARLRTEWAKEDERAGIVSHATSSSRAHEHEFHRLPPTRGHGKDRESYV